MLKEFLKKSFLSMMMVIFLVGTISVVPSNSASAATKGRIYYVDSEAGNDSNNGTSVRTPWKSLEKVNSTTFAPGDKILLKAGSSWNGQCYPKGSGESGSPIIVDMYGKGNKPVIAANGTAESAFRLNNQEYWEVNNLELTNTSSTEGDLRGVYVTASDYGTVNHIYISNCYVHDVNGAVKWKSAYGWTDCKRNGGIIFDVLPGTGQTITNFNDIQILNNNLKDCSMIPVAVWQNDQWGWLTRTSATDTDYYPNTNVIYRGNYIEKVNNDHQTCAMLMYSVRNGLAEYNTVASSNTSGIECGCSDNITFQYNEVSHITVGAGGSDSCAFDQDEQSNNTIIQYNYIHDTQVGFLLYGKGFGTNCDFRYNIAQDLSKQYLYLNVEEQGGVANVYNNVVYNSSTTSVPLIAGTTSGGYSNLYNNIFYGPGTFTKRSNISYDYNCYYGMSTTPTDSHTVTADPKFVNPGTGGSGSYSDGPALRTLGGYKLSVDSPCIGAGKVILDNGGKDFFGECIGSNVTSIGAFEYAGVKKYEAENLSSSLSSGVTKETWEDGASGGYWVKVLSDSVGDYIEFTVNVPSARPYKVVTGYRTGSTRGIANLSINGIKHGSDIDMYEASASFKEASSEVINFSSAGNKTFRYTVTGKNESSTDYGVGIDYIELIPQ